MFNHRPFGFNDNKNYSRKIEKGSNDYLAPKHTVFKWMRQFPL